MLWSLHFYYFKINHKVAIEILMEILYMTVIMNRFSKGFVIISNFEQFQRLYHKYLMGIFVICCLCYLNNSPHQSYFEVWSSSQFHKCFADTFPVFILVESLFTKHGFAVKLPLYVLFGSFTWLFSNLQTFCVYTSFLYSSITDSSS